MTKVAKLNVFTLIQGFLLKEKESGDLLKMSVNYKVEPLSRRVKYSKLNRNNYSKHNREKILTGQKKIIVTVTVILLFDGN